MATNSKSVFISLEQLTWSTNIVVTGGGGIQSQPTATPFLWTIFFKVDGDSFSTSGPAVCFFTDGNHGDLEVRDVHPLDVIPIPETIGMSSMNVTPMPDFVTKQGLSSIFGAVMILMNDGGHVTANGIRAGHDALNQGVQELLNTIVQNAILNFAAPTAQQIEAAVAASNLSDRVRNAILGAQSFCENVWTISGADSEIGHAILNLSSNAFPNPSQTQEFEIEIPVTPNVNVWTIKASVTVADACPASAGAETLNRVFSNITISGAAAEMEKKAGMPDMNRLVELMRNFRDKKHLLRYTEFNDWWNLIKTHAPELACRLGTHQGLAVKMKPILEALISHLENDHQKISRKTIGQVNEVLEILQEKSSCKLRTELKASKSILSHLENYTLHEALHTLATRRLRKDSTKSR